MLLGSPETTKGFPLPFNPSVLLGNLVNNLPDESVDDLADRVCEMADEIRKVRSEKTIVIGENVIANTNEIV